MSSDEDEPVAADVEIAVPARVLATVELQPAEQFARAVPQPRHGRHPAHPVARFGGGSAHTGDQRGGHRARTQPGVLAAPGLDFVQVDPIAHPRADPLGAVELVRRNRDHVGAGHFDLATAPAPHRREIQRVAPPFALRCHSTVGWVVPISLLTCIRQTSRASPRQVLPGVALPVSGDIEGMAAPGIARGVEHRGAVRSPGTDSALRSRCRGFAAELIASSRAAGEDHLPRLAGNRSAAMLVARHSDRGLGLPVRMRCMARADCRDRSPPGPSSQRIIASRASGASKGGGHGNRGVDHRGLITAMIAVTAKRARRALRRARRPRFAQAGRTELRAKTGASSRPDRTKAFHLGAGGVSSRRTRGWCPRRSPDRSRHRLEHAAGLHRPGSNRSDRPG